ncbi:hypothetical protein F0562_002330 [Nyssa sinensis]|uniref:Uncharacterized protein n=1 Tax=Nyssa sinensis TaxID=561372 RepID=A0A5J5C6N7_9ASTE|nr:hypothetical protein F0562_002330 [Nyssa sinensis]
MGKDEAVVEGGDVVGLGVDMETIKKMADIQTGAEVVGVAEVLDMKGAEAVGEEVTVAGDGWAAAQGVVATRLSWGLVCLFALAKVLA